MVGGNCAVVKDVPPFIICGRSPIKYEGLNKVGLRRRGFSIEDIEIIKKTYDMLYNSGLNVSQALIKIEAELGNNEPVKDIISFIRNSKRGIIGR
jgi:UDP-N-acetylglucosamine acyltransferase